MNRVALIGIMVEDKDASTKINSILSQYSEFIIGRMGLPKVSENLSIISVVVDAPENTISALSGKLGQIGGVSSNTVYAKKR